MYFRAVRAAGYNYSSSSAPPVNLAGSLYFGDLSPDQGSVTQVGEACPWISGTPVPGTVPPQRVFELRLGSAPGAATGASFPIFLIPICPLARPPR